MQGLQRAAAGRYRAIGSRALACLRYRLEMGRPVAPLPTGPIPIRQNIVAVPRRPDRRARRFPLPERFSTHWDLFHYGINAPPGQ